MRARIARCRLRETESLLPPDVFAMEIADELEAAFDLFTKIAKKHSTHFQPAAVGTPA